MPQYHSGLFLATGVGDEAPTSEGDGRHRFNAACDDAVGHARVDFGRRDGDGFEAARAVPVHGHAGHFLRVEAHERNHAAEVQALFRFGGGVSDDDVVDARFVQLGKIRHQPTDHLFAQIVGPHEAEPTTWGFGDGGSVPAYNVCVHQFRRILPF